MPPMAMGINETRTSILYLATKDVKQKKLNDEFLVAAHHKAACLITIYLLVKYPPICRSVYPYVRISMPVRIRITL